MRNVMNADLLLENFKIMPKNEKIKFFSLVGGFVFGNSQKETYTHDEVFGDLHESDFSTNEAAEYLEVSVSTFRRYLKDGKIKSSTSIGQAHFFKADDLRNFKKALCLVGK